MIQTLKNKIQNSRTQDNHWKNIADTTLDAPRRESTAHIRMSTRHDCLASHLHCRGIFTNSFCPLCQFSDTTDGEYIIKCPIPTSAKPHDCYWEARLKLSFISHVLLIVIANDIHVKAAAFERKKNI